MKWLAFLLFLVSCGKPPIHELLDKPISCKASIVMPDVRAGETVSVSVTFTDCKEVVK